jgi:hypothetical protein
MALPGVSIYGADGSVIATGGAITSSPPAANLVNTTQTRVTLYDLFGNTLQFGQTGNTDANSALLVVEPVASYNFAFNGATWDRVRQSSINTAVPANASAVTVSASPGRLFGVTVTAVGVTPLVITDGSAGTPIFGLIASPALGYYPIPGGNKFSTSLVVAGSATNPAIVCHYA